MSASGIGVDRPDGRGRTGLDRAGRGLVGNPGVVVREVVVTSDGWHVLRRTTFDYRRRDGRWETQQRETYDRGNGATILLYDPDRRTVLLTRQFRFPAYVNGHPDGMLIETAAGLLDDQDAMTAIRREASEELGVVVELPTHVFDVYMSPGSVTERVHFYAAPYAPASRTGAGGGLAEEGEDIEVLEIEHHEALAMVADGRIADGKTIMLLYWAAVAGPFAGTGGGAPAAGWARVGWGRTHRMSDQQDHPDGKLLPEDVDDADETAPEDDLKPQDHPTPPGSEDEGRAS